MLYMRDCDAQKLVYPERAQSPAGNNFQTKYIAKFIKTAEHKIWPITESRAGTAWRILRLMAARELL